MARSALVFAALLLWGTVGLAVADQPITGTWEGTTSTADGDQVRWKLVIKEDSGRLAAILFVSERGEIPLRDVKIEGDSISFKVITDTRTYETQGKFSGNELEGTWKSGASSGRFKGTRKT